MRWALLLALLSTSALASRADRLSVSPRLDRRDRLGASSAGPSPILSLSLAASGAGECSGSSPPGSVFSRASPDTCERSDGSLVALAAGQGAFNQDGFSRALAGTNLTPVASRRTLTDVAWTATGTVVAPPVVVDSAAAGPFGGTYASSVSIPDVGAGEASTLSQSFASTLGGYALSVYASRAGVGDGSFYLWTLEGGIYHRALCEPPATGFSRCVLPFSALGGAVTYGIGVDTADAEQVPRAASSAFVTDVQLEATTWPTPTLASSARALGVLYADFAPQSPGPICIAAEMRHDPSPPSEIITIMAHLGSTGFGTTNTATLYTSAAGVYFIVYNAAGQSSASEPNNFHTWADGQFHHYMGCADGDGGLSLYIDGVQVGSFASSDGRGILSTIPSRLYVASALTARPMPSTTRTVCVGRSAGACAADPDTVPHDYRIAALGDSITRGAANSASWVGTANEVFRSRGTSAVVTNYGVSGDRTVGGLARWRSQISGHGYTHLTVALGTNDIGSGGLTASAAWANLVQILDEARLEGLVVVPALLAPRDTSAGWTPTKQGELEALNGMISSYCSTYSLPCVDVYGALGDPAAPATLRTAYDSGDGLHPNQAGHDRIAVEMMRGLGESSAPLAIAVAPSSEPGGRRAGLAGDTRRGRISRGSRGLRGPQEVCVSIHTPIPPQSDVRPSRSHAALQDAPHMASVVTRTSAVEIGLVLSLLSMAVSGAGAYFTLRKDVDQLQELGREGQGVARELAQSRVQSDLLMQDMRRDIGEVRAGVQRLEEAVAPTQRGRR